MILTPSVRGEAPEGLHTTGEAVFNSIWTLLHVPCIAIPVGRGPKGLPVGVQIVGPRLSDLRLLDMARAVAPVIDTDPHARLRELWRQELHYDRTVWDKFLTERDKAVFADLRLRRPAGFGKRPALLIIDVNYAFCGDKPEPILESIKKWRNSCGEDAWTALPYIRSLIDKARAKGLPVIYTTGVRRGDLWDSGSWAWKNNRSAEDVANKTVLSNLDGNEIMPQIAPGPRDIVIYKQKPSGFFGTNLTSYLTLLGCDSLIVTGTTTSGCVRASVLDAFSLNYRITLAEEGCFDRAQASHAINLCDMNAKYADVVKVRRSAGLLRYAPGRAVRPAQGKRRVAINPAACRGVIPAARGIDSSADGRSAGILLISRAAATPTLRAYQSALRAPGIIPAAGDADTPITPRCHPRLCSVITALGTVTHNS